MALAVRPELTDVFALKNARHPQLDRGDARDDITPNDVVSRPMALPFGRAGLEQMLFVVQCAG